MSGIEGGGSVESGGSGEVSSSSEVNETSAAETGGESSEATQEATTEEAGESGGFDEDIDTTESPEDSAEDYEESDYDEEPDDSQEVGFSEGDDGENADSQYDDADYENDDISSGDEDGIGFDDSDNEVSGEIDEDAENETESSDLPVDEDKNESVNESEGYDDDSSESNWDDQENNEDLGETENYSDEESLEDSTDDVQDDGEAQTEDTNSDIDSDESDGDMENDGETDDAESDTKTNIEDGDDIDDVQDDSEAQTEDTDSGADGDEVDGDMNNDGGIDGTEDDTETDTEDSDNIDNVQDDGEDEDPGELEDYSDEESLEDSTDDVQDDGEAQTEDTDSGTDGDESDGDMDNNGETDNAESNVETDTEDDDYDEDEDPGELEDYSDEEPLEDSTDDVQDDGEAQTEDTDSGADGDEADGDMDNDGEPDGTETDTESDTEDGDDIDDVQDDGEAQTEDTNSDIDSDEADGDMDNDGEADDAETNVETDTEDDDYDEDEDPGELEDYSDEDTDNRDDETEDDGESERDKEEEEQAVEENQEAADRAENETENGDVENAEKNADDAAESENRSPAENGIEQQTESADANITNEVDTESDASHTGENNSNEAQTDTSENKEDNSTDNRDQTEEQPDNTNAKMDNKADTPEGEDAYRTAMNNMAEYMSEHNYGPDDYAEYSKDPEWYKLNSELQQSLGMEVTPPTHEVAMSNMADYMNEHNYGRDDYSEYSQDPEWQKLNADLQQSLGMEVTTDVSTSSLESGKDVSATELPDNCVMVNASDIDMTYAQGMDSDQFWNHHGSTREDYMRVAEKIPDVQQALDSGKSLDEIRQDPDLKDTANAYFDPENMIKVEQQADGNYSFTDDGRHRIAAAQEFGYEIPVEVTNMPENIETSSTNNMETKPKETTVPEDITNKSDISNETRENLGAFEQNSWDNLSQVEKEQAAEKLRDSIAEDLQLENKPNIAYYNNEVPGDYGGYAASTNTIYINRFNMGNAAETADTIAHESRHCWQHERADNPQTEQDYQFKENFDNYVRPEINFEAYQSQTVEQDARDYAAQVKDLIPQNNVAQEYTSDTFSGNGNEYKTDNSRAPPNEGYQSKTVSELPTDFESKNVADIEIIKKEAPSIRGVDDFRSYMGSVYRDENRTTQEKFEYGKKLYAEIPEGQRTDINVVDNFKAIRTDKESLDKGTESGYLPVAFHDHHGLDESKPINGIENDQSLPDTLCRRGGETGNNLAEPHEDGSVPTTDEIAVPYAENPEAIHIYKTDAEGYKEAIDIISSVDSSNLSEKTQDMNSLIERMNDKYDLNNRPVSEEMLSRYAESYNKFQNSNDTQQCRQDGNCDSKYGVCGTVAPMYVDDNPSKEKLYNGGAAQYNTPCSIETFTRLGVFREDE